MGHDQRSMQRKPDLPILIVNQELGSQACRRSDDYTPHLVESPNFPTSDLRVAIYWLLERTAFSLRQRSHSRRLSDSGLISRKTVLWAAIRMFP